MLKWLSALGFRKQPLPFYRSVFISYSHADKVSAEAIAKALNARGILVWLDRIELRHGDKLTSSLKRAIREREVFVVLVTERSARSEWVLREVEFVLKLEERRLWF